MALCDQKIIFAAAATARALANSAAFSGRSAALAAVSVSRQSEKKWRMER